MPATNQRQEPMRTASPRRAPRRPLLLGAALPLAAALGLGACKDTLTKAAEPLGTLNSTSLANQAGVEGALVSAYRALDWNNSVGGAWGNAASDWVWASVTSDDAHKGSNAGDQPGIQGASLYNWGSSNTDGDLNDKWRGAYEGVSRANAVLTLLSSVQKASPGAIPAAEATSIAGEALFLRAHYHFSAYRLWGNIPYYRETDTDFRKPNEAATAVIADIEKDLDSAIVLLPATPYGGQAGRIKKMGAMAYLGRVQAYNKEWAQALTTLRAVQASGVYSLQPTYDQVWTGRPAYWNGPETILAYEASVNDGEPGGNNGNYGERLNFPYGASHFTCCGFHQPSQDLVNFYAVDPTTGLPAALTNPNWNANNSDFVGGSTTPVDPRLDWTVGRLGTPYKDYGLPDVSWVRDINYSGPYSPKKNAHEQSSIGTSESKVGWTPTQLNAVKIHIFRYADALLLLAEAEVEAGSTDNARQIVNQIRSRAAAGVQGCGSADAVTDSLYPACKGHTELVVPINDPTVQWANYKVGLYPAGSFSDQSYARTAVHYERRLELAMEGQRFFDLKRWGEYQQRLTDYRAVEGARFPSYFSGAGAISSRLLYYPIPSTQIQLSQIGNTPQLKQNPGW
ncbi:hypothetical protein tb265_05910 [Gemmatimonadetes bacterium T265]|nr:hypothetical protein tb265_05910 [Gemmatimonadetes bacterium T265]